jgi:hypothetical protein
MYDFDLAHYQQVAQTLPTTVIQKIGKEQILYHISTVFYAPNALLGLDIEIEVGKPSPLVQAVMKVLGISQLIGMTPQFPASNPQATDEENQRYIQECCAKLTSRGVRHLECKGRALDFPTGGDGCFIVIDGLHLIQDILSDQLSYTLLEQEGVGQLVG